MTDAGSIRTYAFDVALSPPVSGFDNVQDFIANGSVAIASSVDVVNADAPTALPADGGAHPLSCIIAAPPGFMDNAGHITAPGLYAISIDLQAGVAFTTPILPVAFSGAQLNGGWIAGVIEAMGEVLQQSIVALGPGDLPASTLIDVKMPTDATGTLTGIVGVALLAG